MATVEPQNSFKTSHHQSRLINVRKRLMQKVIVVGDYRIGKKIGSGAYGAVYQAYKIQGGQKLAVKIVNITDQNSQYVKNQIQICQKIGHESIVKIFDVIEEEEKIYIFMQYCENGQLFQFIKKNGPLSQEIAGKMFIQLHSALKYLHLKGIAHRDIKAQNVLLDGQMNVKLIDFGLSKVYDKQQPMLDTFCGSPAYVPPEIIKKRKYVGQMVDVWCLGVTLYIMLEAAEPFFSSSNADTKIKIVNYQWSTMDNASKQAKELIKMIFTPAIQRINLKQIESTPFYEKFSGKKMRRFESKSTNSTQKTQRLSTGDGVELIFPEIIHKSTKKIDLLRNMKSKRTQNQFEGILSSNKSIFKPTKSRNLLVGHSNERARTKNDEIIFTMTPKKNFYKPPTQDLAFFKREVVSTLKKY